MAALTRLSDRERDVVTQLLEGKSNKQIASALSISERTVEFHLKNIYDKFHVESRVELVLKLRESTGDSKAGSGDNRGRSNLLGWATTFREAFSPSGKEPNMINAASQDARSANTPLSFVEAVRVCITKYAEFNGRATRPEFWWFTLFIILVGGALAYLSETAVNIFMVAVLLPFLAAGARRLHDTGRSGWWELFIPVPVAGLMMLMILWIQPTAAPLADETTPSK